MWFQTAPQSYWQKAWDQISLVFNRFERNSWLTRKEKKGSFLVKSAYLTNFCVLRELQAAHISGWAEEESFGPSSQIMNPSSYMWLGGETLDSYYTLWVTPAHGASESTRLDSLFQSDGDISLLHYNLRMPTGHFSPIMSCHHWKMELCWTSQTELNL